METLQTQFAQIVKENKSIIYTVCYMIGANYRLSIGNIDFNLLGGSVLKEFARNGTFCTLGYLYNIIPARNRAILGKDFGQTNLSMSDIATYNDCTIQ